MTPAQHTETLASMLAASDGLDPICILLEFFEGLDIALADCFHKKDDPHTNPLRIKSEDHENDDVDFEISSTMSGNRNAYQERKPADCIVPQNGKQLRCAFWHVADKQDAQGRFVVTRTRHVQESKNIMLRGMKSTIRPGIGYTSEEKTYPATIEELTGEFRTAVYEILTPAQGEKLLAYYATLDAQVQADKLSAERSPAL